MYALCSFLKCIQCSLNPSITIRQDAHALAAVLEARLPAYASALRIGDETYFDGLARCSFVLADVKVFVAELWIKET